MLSNDANKSQQRMLQKQGGDLSRYKRYRKKIRSFFMYIDYFESFIKKDMQTFFGLVKTEFGDGDFGKLTRVEFFSNKIIGLIDFWSYGWLEVDVYKIHNEDLVQIYHKLFKPDECNTNVLYSCKEMIINEYNK